ncbi:response regulator [Pleurocapsa sp. PCC 7319]|uniref:response regulator n=1 Tax=Pleurocapsa sp. PCC 7319 TaxID=118161 RepID=UPI00036E3533|nr:response regulator [Pleurocapsa sp. PCC 7319]
MRFKKKIKQLKERKNKLFLDKKTIPLGLVIIIPFILNIVTTVSIIEYFSVDKEQKNIDKIDSIVNKSSASIRDRVFLYLYNYLETNHTIPREQKTQLLPQTVNRYLQQIDVGFSATAIIIDKNGSIIASNHGQQDKMLSTATQDILTALNQRFSNLSDIEDVQQISFGEKQQRVLGQITPWRDDELGFDWLVIVTIPESELSIYSQAEPNKQRLRYLVYLLPANFLGIVIYVWITLGIKNLSKTASVLAQGKSSFSLSDTPITEFKVLVQSLRQLASQLQLNNQRITELDPRININYEYNSLLADMSHDLRSPLNAILGFAQIMEKESSMTRSQQENLAIINRSGKRLLSVINDVVDLSKLETNRLILEENSFDFPLWLDSMEKSIKFQAHNQGLEFSLIRHGTLPQYICLDERRLRQVLTNLIDYSLRYTQAGEVVVRVACIATTVNSVLSVKPKSSEKLNIYFEVENTDFPITPEELETLFVPSTRACQNRKSPEGSFLSLPISHQLAQLMGGDITVSTNNNLKQGITFRLDIETEAIIKQELKIPSAPQKIIGLEPNQTEYRILIVDDSKTNRQIMVQLLEPVGFKVQEASNGKEAVDIWLRWQPHMIWMDIRMPIMNGYEATEQIRSYPQTTTNTLIVALTAGTLEEEKKLFQAAGCDDFVGKPFTDSIIFDKVAQHLGVRYIYEPIPCSTTSNFKFTANALKMMSSEWLSQVEQAALSLDKNLLSQLIQKIPPEHTDLRQALQTQVDNFDFDKILDLVIQSMIRHQ